MFSKTFFFAAAIASYITALSAVPAGLPAGSRQESGFVFAVGTEGPVTAASPPMPEDPVVVETPTEPPAEIAIETDAMGAAMAPSMDPSMTPSAVPEKVAEVEPAVSAEPMIVPEMAYNVGGGATGKFEKDPEDWIVGETGFFEIPDAVIGGAEPENAEIYKSHRYGLLGSTWGYDLPVTTPGNYECTLHYAETFSDFFTADPNRTFAVEVSGDASEAVQTEEFDVMVELQGAEFTAYTKTFTNIAVATTIKIRETPSIGDAFLSGITCMYLSPLEITV